MWKDPIFSASLAILSLLLMDAALSKGHIIKTSRTWLLKYVGASLLVIFSRNNGAYIIALVGLSLFVLFLFARIRKHDAIKNIPKVFGVTAVVLVFSFTITGPVYKNAGVITDGKVESVGILLSQMARVAASDGNMTVSDREYMNDLMPLEMYKSTYRPCCIDLLKWNSNFNTEVLDNGFLTHWASMLLLNPVTYFEAWELQTCGFWAMNQPDANSFTGNLASGVPRNTVTGYEKDLSELGITPENKLQNADCYKLFPQDEWSIPLGFIHWALLFLAICLVLLHGGGWLLALIPSFGLAFTLAVASPIWYWPRYGAAEQFLIPFYIAIIILLVQKNNGISANSQTS